MREQPWHELPAAVVAVLRPALDEVAGEIIQAVATVPAYARPLDGPFGEGLRVGVQQALRHFLAEIEAGGAVERPDVYRALGQGEMRAGRSLESLLAAYRIGARVAWRRFAALGMDAGLAPETLYRLAEALFAYIDLLSAESAEGHAQARSAVAGEAELRRRRLVRMLVREAPADADVVRAAAAEAGWPLPRRLAALAIVGAERESIPERLPQPVVSESLAEVVCVLVADPDGPARRAALEQALAGARARAGLGTAVDWTEARISFLRAQAAAQLADQDGELVAAGERTGELLLGSDRRLAAELAAQRLAPLAELTPGSRRRLQETLRVWLAEQGRLAAVAHRLAIHPQTARYRLARLRDLFGAELDDPEARFWLEVALRVPAVD